MRFREKIEEIKARTDIIAVAGDFMELETIKPSLGRGVCPHCSRDGVDTPTLFLDSEKGHYFCRRCRDHGDVIQLFCRFNSASFSEAVTVLAERAGVPLGSDDFVFFGGPRSKVLRESKEVSFSRRPLPEVNPTWAEHALKFADRCAETLRGAPKILDFLKNRGVPPWTARRYSLGWNPKTSFRPARSWGLDRDGLIRLPSGITIPERDAEGRFFRLWILVAEGDTFTGKFWLVSGSLVGGLAWWGSRHRRHALIVDDPLRAVALAANQRAATVGSLFDSWTSPDLGSSYLINDKNPSGRSFCFLAVNEHEMGITVQEIWRRAFSAYFVSLQDPPGPETTRELLSQVNWELVPRWKLSPTQRNALDRFRTERGDDSDFDILLDRMEAIEALDFRELPTSIQGLFHLLWRHPDVYFEADGPLIPQAGRGAVPMRIADMVRNDAAVIEWFLRHPDTWIDRHNLIPNIVQGSFSL